MYLCVCVCACVCIYIYLYIYRYIYIFYIYKYIYTTDHEEGQYPLHLQCPGQGREDEVNCDEECDEPVVGVRQAGGAHTDRPTDGDCELCKEKKDNKIKERTS